MAKKAKELLLEEKPESKLNTEESELESETELDADADGNRYLDGIKPVVPKKIVPLIDLTKKIETELKENFASARDALVQAQEKLMDLAHQNIEHFTENEKGEKIYRHSGVEVKLTYEKEKIKTALEKEPE